MSAKTMAEVLAEHRVGSYRVGSHAGIEHMPDIGVYVSRCNTCGPISESPTAHQAAALSAAGFGLVADAKAEALDALVANSPRLPSAVRNVVFEAVFDVVDKFNFPAQNMGYRKDVVEIGDVCGDVEKRIIAIIRAAAVRGEG